MERENSKLMITDHGDKIFLNAVNELDPEIYDVPLTIEFTTGWKIVKVTNSAADGIYNPRNNKIYINVVPNKEVVIERISY